MEFAAFKALLALLLFGAVFVFGFWQLASLRRTDDRQREPVRERPPSSR